MKARVIEVVPEKDRIALNLKPAPAEDGSAYNDSRGAGEGVKSKRQPPKSRSAALADLDALFKK